MFQTGKAFRTGAKPAKVSCDAPFKLESGPNSISPSKVRVFQLFRLANNSFRFRIKQQGIHLNRTVSRYCDHFDPGRTFIARAWHGQGKGSQHRVHQ
jgi:hypothetical protein